MNRSSKQWLLPLALITSLMIAGTAASQETAASHNNSSPHQATVHGSSTQHSAAFTGRTVKDSNSTSSPGQRTRNLLELQRSGVHASSHRQYISGPEMALIYRRYLDSFSHPVPALLIRPDFTAQ